MIGSFKGDQQRVPMAGERDERIGAAWPGQMGPAQRVDAQEAALGQHGASGANDPMRSEQGGADASPPHRPCKAGARTP